MELGGAEETEEELYRLRGPLRDGQCSHRNLENGTAPPPGRSPAGSDGPR